MSWLNMHLKVEPEQVEGPVAAFERKSPQKYLVRCQPQGVCGEIKLFLRGIELKKIPRTSLAH